MRYRQAGRDAQALEGITTLQPDDPPVIVRREAEGDLCRLLGDVCDGEANINAARYEQLLRNPGDEDQEINSTAGPGPGVCL